jgi:putative peptidoglycan lipid II flippase
VKASLTGLAANLALKVLLMAPLAQVGLALATAVGAWINLLLVLGLAMRAGYLDLDRALMRSLAKFAASGVVLAAALWATAKLASAYLAPLPAFRDETTLLALIAVGAIVYAGSILLLFGTGWLRSLVRS